MIFRPIFDSRDFSKTGSKSRFKRVWDDLEAGVGISIQKKGARDGVKLFF